MSRVTRSVAEGASGRRRTHVLPAVLARGGHRRRLLVGLGASAATASAHTATGLVRGVVVLGPLTTGDRGAQLSWPPQKAVVKIFRHGRDKAVRTLRTGADGLFSVRLPAGTYRFAAELPGPSTLPIPHDAVTRVKPGKTSRVRLWLDTGLQFPDAKDSGQSVEATTTPPGTHKYGQGVVGTTAAARSCRPCGRESRATRPVTPR